MADLKPFNMMTENELENLLNNPEEMFDRGTNVPSVQSWLDKKTTEREKSNASVKSLSPLQNSPMENNPDNDMLAHILKNINTINWPKQPNQNTSSLETVTQPSLPTRAIASVDNATQSPEIKPISTPTLPQPINLTDDAMATALKRQKENAIALAMLQGASDIGRSIAYQDRDPNFTANLKPLVGMDVESIKEQRKSDKEKMDLDAEKRKSDPGSDRSEMARASTKDFLNKMGYSQLASMIKDNMSARDVEDAMGKLNLQNLYAQWEAGQAKKDTARIMAESRAERKEEDVKKFTRDLRKEATTGNIGKLFNNFVTAERVGQAFDQFAANPTGYSDYATLMGGLKVLQGDESVVREAEIRLGMNAGSLSEKAKNYIDQLATGKSLQPSQRKAIIQTVTALRDAARNQYKQALEPLVQQARGENLDVKQILPAQAQPLFNETDKMLFNVDQNEISKELNKRMKQN